MVSNVTTSARAHGNKVPQVLQVVCPAKKTRSHSGFHPLAIHDSRSLDRVTTYRYGILRNGIAGTNRPDNNQQRIF